MIDKENFNQSSKEPVKPLSPSLLLTRVIDPTTDIKPVFRQYLMDSYNRRKEKGLQNYSPVDLENFLENMSGYFIENIIDGSEFLADLRNKATKILQKDHILVDSHFGHIAEKMHHKMVRYCRHWLEAKGGQAIHPAYNAPIDGVIQEVEQRINSQAKFIQTLRGKSQSDATSVDVYVPTFDSKKRGRKHLSRIDNGQATLRIMSDGKITNLSITELFSYTNFSNRDTDVSIVNLATNIPDELADKFVFGGDVYSTGTIPNTKIKISGRQHDYAGMQFWINCSPKPGTSNQDCINFVKLWLETLKKHPRVLKPKK